MAMSSLLVFPLFLASVFTISTSPRRPSSNAAPFNPLQPINAYNFTAPLPPAGYHIDRDFDETIPLSPLGVYMNAIELMYKLAQSDWDGVVDGGFRMSVSQYNVYILVVNAPSDRLEASHVVIALQDAVVAMIRLKAFFGLACLISLDGQVIGQMDFGNRDEPSNKRTTVSVPWESSLLLNSNQSTSSPSDSGHIVDPYDPKFVITYDFYGKAIDTKEIFTVVLEALAISAQIGRNHHCSVLEANSISGVVAISIAKALDISTQLRYSAMTKTLLILVTGVIVPERKFKEVEFSLVYDGTKVAEGHMFKVAMANNSTGGIPASKSSVDQLAKA